MNQQVTENVLRVITRWPTQTHQDFHDLLKFVRRYWYDCQGEKEVFHQTGNHRYELHTLGWSDNGNLIEALKANTEFWRQAVRVERDVNGYYVFDLPCQESLK